MTKQLQATLAAILVMSTISVRAQLSTSTTTSRPSSNTTKTTVVTTDRSASKSQKRSTTRKSAAKRKPVESSTAREIRELREQMASQQAQLDALKQQNADKDAKLASATSDAQAASASAAAATAQAQSLQTLIQANSSSVQTLSSDVSDLRVANTGIATTLSDARRDLNEKIESPTTMHYKGITITPVAFFAFENVYRQRSLNSDVNSPFNATPYPGAGQAHTSELNFSGRQSRLGGLLEGNTGPFKLSGYFEADFLSAGATSNSNQSNSYTLRQRQIWGQAATKSGFAVTGGQMWSLVTETKKSTDNRTENLPMTVDAQYHVGFSWARQAALRFQQKFGGASNATLALSLENAQMIYSATNANPNFFLGNAGAGGGLYNATANYSNNVAPDIIVKAAFDPKYGHFEVGGLTRFFRDRYYPNQTSTPASATGGTNDTKVGAGFFANARFPVTHYVDFGLHVAGGKGIGRYGTSTLPDVTVHPNGTLAPINNGQGLFSMELHPNKKVDLFAYTGAEYAQRTLYVSTIPGSSFGKVIGYAPSTSSNAGCGTETLPTSTGNGLAGGAPYNPGTPANCLGATRVVVEGTAGFTYRVYTSPKFGRLQYQVQYSYLDRQAWTGTGATPGSSTQPKATNNMVFTGMRYYIP
ncbi:MAG: hypothetical protein NVSMB3_04020 [Acidobacteriaceae bacterium]